MRGCRPASPLRFHQLGWPKLTFIYEGHKVQVLLMGPEQWAVTRVTSTGFYVYYTYVT